MLKELYILKKLVPYFIILLFGGIFLSSINSVSAHHGTANDYWHVYWDDDVRTNLQYDISIVNESGGNYNVQTAVNDWNNSQSYVDFVSWDSSTYPNPFLTIDVDSRSFNGWGKATTNPSWKATKDTTLITATAAVNSKNVEDAINNDNRPANLRRKVITHEIGHTLGLAHPSNSSRKTIMKQGWNGYSTVQSSDLDWIEYRYT